MPERMPEDIPGRMSDRMSGDLQRFSDRMSEDLPVRSSGDMPGRMSGRMSGDWQRMSDRMSQRTSDRMFWACFIVGYALFAGRLRLFQMVHRPVCVLTGGVLTCFVAEARCQTQTFTCTRTHTPGDVGSQLIVSMCFV